MRRSIHIQAAILILFFLSGVAGLVYEVVWQRMLVLVFGNTTLATTTIIAAFMGGLALGSFYFGRIADRSSRPLRLYVYLEVGIGVFAILIPFIMSGISAIYVNIAEDLSEIPYLLNIIKFTLCFLVLLIPSSLMGGTLPVISKVYINQLSLISRSVGNLYGSNTLGGVIGAFIAGFFLISWLGVRETTYAAVILNILIAGAALLLDLLFVHNKPASSRFKEETKIKTTQQVYPKYVFSIVLVVYALSGFCALAYEVLWTRLLVFFLGNTTYAFTTMLTTFLTGLALGSFIFARYIDRSKHLLPMLAVIEVLIGLFAISSIWYFASLRDWILGLYGSNWYDITGIRYIGAFFIMFFPTLLMGIAFPLVNKIYAINLAKVGQRIANLYSVNTLGSVLGSFAAGFVLIPLIGVTKSIVLIATINLVLGAVVLLPNFLAKHKIKRAATGVVAILLVIAVALTTAPNIALQQLSSGQKLLFYKEGSSATVVILQHSNGLKELRVNGVSEVGTNFNSLRTLHMLGHLPMLLSENPQKVLVIAFGAGVSGGAVAEHPVQEIDAVEIAPEVIEASEYLRLENQAVLDDPRLNLIIEDGRNYLLRTTSQYDVITSDSTHPMAGDSWLLYTREFYELCWEKLNSGGIMAQWLPIHGLAPVDYKTILKTFQSVFPDISLWSANQYTLIVGSKGEFKIDYTRFAQKLQGENVKEDLEEFLMSDPIQFLSNFIMGKEGITEYTMDIPINTDNHPIIQFSESRKESGAYDYILSELRDYRESVIPLLINMGDEVGAIENRLAR